MRSGAACVGLAVIGLAVVIGPVHSAAGGEYDALGGQIKALAADKDLAKVRVGIRVVALGIEKPVVVYNQNADELFKPASNQKVVTTAAALTMLPHDFKYRTLLGMLGHDLVVIGAGDPSIGDPKLAKVAHEPVTVIFERWADRLKAEGILSVSGDLLFDDSIFDSEFIPAGWRGEHNLGDWYAAPVGGLNFNDNCVDVILTPGEKGKPAIVKVIPDWVKVTNKTVSGGKGQPVIQRESSDPLTISVSRGVSRPTGEEDPTSVPVEDPGMLFAQTVRSVLASKGIKIDGKVRRHRVRQADGSLPSEFKIVAAYESKPIDFLWRMNKSSMNVFAEALFKTLGAYAGGKNSVGTRAAGAAVVREFLAKAGVKTEGFMLDDGSGLGHTNRISPAALCESLVFMDHQLSIRKQWWAGFAVPGDPEGTLRRRMPSLKGLVYAKTGYIGGVSALSGYVVAADHKRYFAFSILCNDTGKSKNGATAAKSLEDEVCKTLAAFK
jgi:serine-type D-Ala-D-Ala carboxypeptidase/endopeptidase (penicillin-binding protein 4)